MPSSFPACCTTQNYPSINLVLSVSGMGLALSHTYLPILHPQHQTLHNFLEVSSLSCCSQCLLSHWFFYFYYYFSSLVTFFVPCLVHAMPIKLLTVKSLPIIIGLTRLSHTTNSCTKNVFPILNFIVITPCVFISHPDAFLSFGNLAAFKSNFSLANMSIDIELFSAPVSNRALTSLSCTLMGNIVPVSLLNIMLKTCSISLQTHSTKYSFRLYLHSSHLSFTSSSEASVSLVRFESSASGNCIPCMRLTSSLHISCPVTV